jgi:O-antigen ligase
MRTAPWPSASPRNLSLPTGITLVVAAVLAPLMGRALAREDWQILALLSLIMVVPMVIRWPIISTFGMYALLVPFDFLAVLGGNTLTKLVGMLAAAVLLGAGLMERRLCHPPRAALWWAMFMLWALTSAAWTILDPRTAIQGMQMILSLFLLYVIAVSVRVSEKELVWVCALAVLGATLAAGWSVVHGVEGAYDVSGSASHRSALKIAGQGAALNAFATTLIPALALAMGGFMGLRSWVGKMVAVAAMGVISAGIFFTMSRAALLGIATTAAVLFYRFRMRWPVFVVVCLLLIGVAATMPAAFFDRILAVGDKDATGSGRTKIWSIGLEALESNWLVGAGFKSFLDVYSRTVPLPLGQGGRAAHNIYLAISVELGIVGLVLFLGAITSHLVMGARRARGGTSSETTTIVVRSMEAACYGVLVTSFFIDALWSKYFWLLWILLAWSVQVREEQVASPHGEGLKNHRRGLAAATSR